MESKYIDRPGDLENTVLKIAKKRALVDAVLMTFGISDRFTQDVEDMPREIIPTYDEIDPGNSVSNDDIPFQGQTYNAQSDSNKPYQALPESTQATQPRGRPGRPPKEAKIPFVGNPDQVKWLTAHLEKEKVDIAAWDDISKAMIGKYSGELPQVIQAITEKQSAQK